MAAFNVTINELVNKANELSNLNQRFQTEVNNLVDLEGTLNGMWEGDARKAFHTAFGNDITQMGTFYNAVNEYVRVLLETAQKYADAENTNVDIANTRTYG